MSQIVLVKLQKLSWSYGNALAPSRHCRLDPASNQHGAIVDEQGTLHYFHIDVASRSTTELLSFQLQFRASSDSPFEPISKPWRFEFVPGLPGELMIVQPGSARILYASLPRQDSDASDVFLFGSHTASVNCITNNGNIALSGCDAGVLKLWRLADGQLADSVPLYDNTPAAVTAVECIGPLLVAAGNAAGSVTLYDIASGRLLAVQRLEAGRGPISCLTSWLDSELLSGAILAPPGPRVPDGGGVLPGPNIGIPWRHEQQQQQSDEGNSRRAPAALLAVAGPAGWLRIYQASQAGPLSWQLLHSSHGSVAAPITALAFTPHGDTLAVAGPAAQVLGTDAVAVAAAGGQPGAVSLYMVDGGAGVQQELQLWQQWALRSLPVGLVVLPSTHVDLMKGKQLEPTQILHLLVEPELGPSLVLTATQPLVSSSSSTAQHMQPTSSTSPQRQLHQQGSPDTGQKHPPREHQWQQQQQQQMTGSAGDYSRLNIAERDWAAVADAIQGAKPLQESSDLMVMLENLIAETNELLDRPDMESDTQHQHQQAAEEPVPQPQQDAYRSYMQQQQQEPDMPKTAGARKQLFSGASSLGSTAHDPMRSASLQASSVFGQGMTIVDKGPGTLEQGPVPSDLEATFRHSLNDKQQQSATEATAEDGDLNQDVALAGRTFSASAGLGNILAAAAAAEREPPAAFDFGVGPRMPSQEHAAAARNDEALASASSSAKAAAAAGDALFMRPSTLPTLRSWMDRATALAAGTAAEGPTAAVDFETIAEEMRQHQQAILQQQQQVPEQQDRAPAAVEVLAADHPVSQQQQEHLQAENELPCESTFQDLMLNRQQQQQQQQYPPQGIPPVAGAAAARPPSPEVETIVELECAGNYPQYEAAAAAGASTAPAPADESFKTAAFPANTSSCRSEASAAAVDDLQDLEPQPRTLPAALQMQRPQSTGPRLPIMHHQQPGFAAAAGMAAPRPFMPRPVSKPAAASLPAAVQVTPVNPDPALQLFTADAAAGSSSSQQEQTWPDQGRQQHRFQQQQQQRDCEQPKGPRNVRERLGLRQRQRQQQEPALSGAAGTPVDVVLPVNDHPLAAAVSNSSRLLAKKIQEAEEAPAVTIDPSDVVKLAVQLTDLNVDFDQQQYHGLPDLKDISTPTKVPKVVPKQLDPRWLASRNLKPQMETLFKPSDWQPSNIQPQVLVLPQWPTPQQVVQQLLWPQAGQ